MANSGVICVVLYEIVYLQSMRMWSMELSIEIKNYFNKIQIKKRIGWSRNKDQDECDGAK